MSQEQQLSPVAVPLTEKIAAPVRTINGYILTVLAFLLVGCVVWQVVSRYTAAKPSTVTDELARFTFMWIGLLGAAQASAYKQHLAIDLLAMKLKGKAKMVLNILIECCVILFSGFVMIKGGLALTAKTFANQQITPALQWPMGYVYMIVPIAGALMIFFSVIAICENLQSQPSQAQSEGDVQ